MPCHDRNGLRRIHRAAAAQANDAVMAARLQRGQSGPDHLVGRVGDYAIEHPASDVAFGETFAHPAGNPLTHHDLVGDDKRMVCAPNPREDVGNQIQTAFADLQDARYADSYRFPHLLFLSLRVTARGATPSPTVAKWRRECQHKRENSSHFANRIQCRMIDPSGADPGGEMFGCFLIRGMAGQMT